MANQSACQIKSLIGSLALTILFAMVGACSIESNSNGTTLRAPLPPPESVRNAVFDEDRPRPVSTYSIVARDGETGRLGVAVQSHWFSVGSVVPWAEAGVGAVATQSLAEVTYGPLGLDLMRAGKSAPKALESLTAVDEGAEYRQVAMIDAQGRVAAHTGESCIAYAGHRTDDLDDGTVYSVQANLMGPPSVPDAMASAFENAEGDLAERLVTALEAAQREGGDIRGKQSAALLVVEGESSGKPWADRVVELRIEDHPEPVKELRRLLSLHRAYEHMNAGDAAIEKENIEAALKHYSAALDLAPGHAEMAFWTGVSLAGAGRVEDALPYFAEAFADEEGDWREVLRRLPPAGLLPGDEELLDRILDVQPDVSNDDNDHTEKREQEE